MITPGEWKVDPDDPKVILGLFEGEWIDIAQAVCPMWSKPDNGKTSRARAMREPNARRIVTAVNCHDELLAACKAAIDHIEAWEAEWAEMSPAGNQLRAAIAAAEGEA